MGSIFFPLFGNLYWQSTHERSENRTFLLHITLILSLSLCCIAYSLYLYDTSSHSSRFEDSQRLLLRSKYVLNDRSKSDRTNHDYNPSMCTSFPPAMHMKKRKEEWKRERGEYAENMVLTGENSSLAKRVFRFREYPHAPQLSSCPTSHCTDCLLPFTYERGWYRGTLHITAKEWRTMSGKCSAIIRIMSASFRGPTMPSPYI